jgi:hypothetical protein
MPLLCDWSTLFLVLACVVLVFLCRAGLCGFGKLELVLIKVSCVDVSRAIPFFLLPLLRIFTIASEALVSAPRALLWKNVLHNSQCACNERLEMSKRLTLQLCEAIQKYYSRACLFLNSSAVQLALLT